MTIDSIKELDKLLKLCRKHGVSSLKVDNIEFKLENLPSQQPKILTESIPYGVGITADTRIPIPNQELIQTPDQLSDEQLMYWSTDGETQPS